jgi:hypothetical protein
MNRNIEIYAEILEELFGLLEKYNEENWVKYFTESKRLLDRGKPQKSIAHSLGAYGGMCSFNDELYFAGATPKEASRGFELRDELWKQSKKSQNIIKRVLEL